MAKTIRLAFEPCNFKLERGILLLLSFELVLQIEKRSIAALPDPSRILNADHCNGEYQD